MLVKNPWELGKPPYLIAVVQRIKSLKRQWTAHSKEKKQHIVDDKNTMVPWNTAGHEKGLWHEDIIVSLDTFLLVEVSSKHVNKSQNKNNFYRLFRKIDLICILGQWISQRRVGIDFTLIQVYYFLQYFNKKIVRNSILLWAGFGQYNKKCIPYFQTVISESTNRDVFVVNEQRFEQDLVIKWKLYSWLKMLRKKFVKAISIFEILVCFKCLQISTKLHSIGSSDLDL